MKEELLNGENENITLLDFNTSWQKVMENSRSREHTWYFNMDNVS